MHQSEPVKSTNMTLLVFFANCFAAAKSVIHWSSADATLARTVTANKAAIHFLIETPLSLKITPR
ncbi:hypothetical protein SDC9_172572 [bioreactor metagenome]|uniref:Uncharacterized protein n=1 Tax=bioreactor metagenome TaxID=1076179 RepID=A0A645GEQ3_9ZZZZ